MDENDSYDYPKINLLDVKDIKKNKTQQIVGTNNVVNSLEVNDIPFIDSDKNVEEIEKGDCSEKENLLINQHELSSSQSSINSSNAGAQELTLDLTLFDDETPVKRKCWKSPDQVRLGYVKTVAKHFEGISGSRIVIAQSVSELRNVSKISKKNQSTDDLNDKLSETERLEIFKQLQDWSVFGTNALETNNIGTAFNNMIQNEIKTDLKQRKYKSESNISEPIVPDKTKSYSEPYLADFDSHKCSFKNCIFKLKPDEEPPTAGKPLKGILKNVDENLKIIDPTPQQKPFNCRLVKCDSLDSINRCQKMYRTHVYPITEFKKFPESYIVTKKSNNSKKYASETNLFFCNCLECRRRDMIKKGIITDSCDSEKTPKTDRIAPKIVFLHKKAPKPWKSCSDIVHKKKLKKCCRYAKRTCPVLKTSDTTLRDSKSCNSITEDIFDETTQDITDSKKTSSYALSFLIYLLLG